MTSKIRKGKKTGIIVSLVFSCVILAVSIVSIVLLSSNKENAELDARPLLDDAYFEELKLDAIEESNLVFDSNDDGDNTVTFKGFKNVTSDNYENYYKFLNIPEVLQSGQTVTRIDLTSMSISSAAVRSLVRGVKIPKSVTYIESYSFFGFGSLEYFETPFIGTERGSSGIGRLYPDDYTKVSKPFVSMFASPFTDMTDDSFDNKYEGDSIINGVLTTGTTQPGQVAWYEKNDGDANYYYVPGNLQKIIVYDDTTIGNHALFNLNMVTSIEITKDPEELAKSGIAFGDYALAESTSLQEVILPSDYVSLGTGLFSQCTALTSAKLPGKLTAIPTATFDNCIRLEEVLIPASIEDIGAAAFNYCQSLKSIARFDENWDDVITKSYDIDLPTGLKTIGDDAFNNCYEFKKIYVPNSVTFIGDSAFQGCIALEEIRLPFVGAHRGTEHIQGICNEGENSYKFHNLFGFIFGISGDADFTYTANQKYANNTANQNFAIPKTLKSIYINDDTVIADGALQNLTSVEALTLNDGITSISEGALNGCTALGQLSLPFAGSSAYSGGHIGHIFGKTAYNGGVSSSTYYIPQALKTVIITNQPIIYTNTFANCTNIESVEIGNATTEFREQVFYNNPVLKKLSVPFVGNYRGIFNPDYWWWRDEAWRNTLQWLFSSSYHDGTYANNSLRWYDSYIKYIPSSLEEVTITDDTVLSTYSFKNFSSLKVLNITSDRLSHVDQAAMSGCYNLEVLNVPFIGQNKNSSGYSGREYTIGWFFGQGRYSNSYAAGQYVTYYIPNNLTAITISGSSAKIPDYAMAGMTSLKSFTSNATIDTLGNSAFYNCRVLETVNMPNARYQTVGNYAFYNCQNLYNIDAIIPQTVRNIGNYAFSGSSVGGDIHPLELSRYTSIGNYAFSNCHQIESIELSVNNKTLGEGVFQDCQYLTDVTLAGKVSKYLFKNCYMLEDIDFTGITVIPEGVLSGCKSLKVADGNGNGFIQDELTSEIGAYAFYGCSSLDSFTLRYTTQKIGSYAFSECTGLEYMIIPKETAIIDPHGWDNCNPNFFFYVYEAEEDWPTGWVENWNCYYPVYIIGQQNDSIFTYQYYPAHKGYFITGVEEGIVLEGQVQLPSYHDGLRVLGVYGITEDGSVKNNIAKQTGITSIVIPKSYYFIYDGVFTTGNRVDLYFEHTKSEVAAIQNNTSIPSEDNELKDNYQKGWTVEEDEDNWISGGLVFYGSDWQYINATTDSKVPAIKASSLEFELDFGGNATIYNGRAITPEDITAIKLPAYVVVSQAAGVTHSTAIINENTFALDVFENTDYYLEDFTDMFTYTYENNIAAGTATMIATLRTARYQQYLNGLKDADQNQVLIVGNKRQNFTIEKARIDLYYDGLNFEGDNIELWETTGLTHEYNQYQWKNSNWNTTNTSGLESFTGAKFNGTLATAKSTVGTYYYNSSYDGVYHNNGNFVWTNPWSVTRNGVDISRNFEVYLYLVVEIKPMKVTIEWTGGSWNNDVTKDYYQYRYNGSEEIKPQAQALWYDSANNTVTDDVVESCIVIAANTNATGRFPSETLYEAYAYLKDNHNYMLVDELGNQIIDNHIANGVLYSAYVTNYMIIQGLIRININASYVISPTEDNWSYLFDEYTNEKIKTLPAGYTITGLGKDSVFHGKLVTLGDAVGIYSYTDDEAITSGNYIKWFNTFGPDGNGYSVEKQFHIYRKTDNGDGTYSYIDELALGYYEVYIDNVSINLQYDTFDVEYYVSQIDGTNEERVPFDDTTNNSNRHIVNITYAVDGKTYRLFIKTSNATQSTPEYVINYFTDNGLSVGRGELTFKEIGEYFIGVTINARHFNAYQANVNLTAIKSDIKFASSLDKVYDRYAHDLFNDNLILKMGEDQEITAKYYYQYDVNHLNEIEAPINAGAYTIYITAKETDYFNGIEGRYVNFQITRRVIKIDLSGANTAYNEGQLTGSKPYDGTPQRFTPTNSDLIANGYVLGDEYVDGILVYGAEQFVGSLSTAGATPGVYDKDGVYWTTSWGVFTADGVNNSNNYQVQIDNAFEIVPLQFTIIEHNIDVEFDYNLHQATVDVSPTDSNYRIYYSTIPFESGITDFSGYSTLNYDFATPGSYIVYYAVVADNYQTVIDYLTVNIRAKNIIYQDPAKDVINNVDTEMHYIVDATGSYQSYVVVVDDPIYATVYYSLDNRTWQTTPFELCEVGYLDIYYKIEALYYNTVYSMKDNVAQPIRFMVSEDNLPELDDNYKAEGYQVIYDGLEHSPRIITPAGFNGKVLYSTDYVNWSETPIGYTNAGSYDVYVRIRVNGYKTKEFRVTIKIENLSFSGLTLQKYDDFFDGEYHTVGINGLDMEIIQEEDPNNPGQYLERVVYKYNGTEVNVGFTSNPNVVNAGYGYLSELSYKDVGFYTIYVMVSAPNYNSINLGASTVNIKFRTGDSIDIEYNYVEIEYTKARFDTSSLNIKTIHDGVRIYQYWAAHEVNGELVPNLNERIPDPQELGYYCFRVEFAQSRNCGAAVLGEDPYYVYFKIVPRKITVEWIDEVYYDGLGHSPEPKVETGTTDQITLNFECLNSTDPFPSEIGEYEFRIWMSTENKNYVLDRDTISMVIIKRQLTIDFKDSKEYDGDIYEKTDGWEAVLNLDILQRHKFVASMQTNRAIKGEYYYTTESTEVYSNTVIVEWDIIQLDENFEPVIENGEYVSVLDLYDYTLTVTISITDPLLDLSFIEDTVVYYNGDLQTVDIRKQLPAILDGAVLSYRLVGEEAFRSNPISYINAGTYEMEVRVQKGGYEPTICTTKLIIKKADLEIDIFELDDPDNIDDDGYDIYDSQQKHTNYKVLNVKSSEIDNFITYPNSQEGHMRYYKASEYTLEQLQEFYSSFNKNSSIFTNSLEKMVDAGDYYCVVYYADTAYKWNESYAIEKVTIKQKDIDITFFAPGVNTSKVYNKEKFAIPLSNAVADETDLISGHDFLNDLMYHFVRTNSANAGIYNPKIGFEFVEKTIYDEAGNDVSMNYHPVLSDNVRVEIERAYLTDDDFIVEDNIKEYDGLVASPKITTPSDGEIEYIFKYYDDEGNSHLCNPSNFQSDVGRYYVGINIGQGTNYYASTEQNPNNGYMGLATKYANCVVLPKEAEVVWENVDVEFNGQVQSADASITDVFGNQISLEVFYYDNNGDVVEGFVASGIYEAYAKFSEDLLNYDSFIKNYNLNKTITAFKIRPIVYDIVLGTADNGYSVTKKYTGSPWNMVIDETVIDNFPEGLTIKGLSGDNALLTTTASDPGSYSGNEMFNFNDIKVYKDLEEVTQSIGFNVIGTVTIISDRITFIPEDKTFIYSPDIRLFSQTGALKITNPSIDECSIDYKVNGEVMLTEPTFTDVGTYEVEFTIKDKTGKYADASGTVFIYIVAAESFIEFDGEIGKVYDGTPVSVNVSEDSGFNGTTQDLDYDYYEIITDQYGIESEVYIGKDAPIDVGDYRVNVTCNESYNNSNGVNNYTALNVSKTFSITPREYKLNINISQTIEAADEGKIWDSGIITHNSQNELISGNVLEFNIQSKFNIIRTTYTAKKTIYYSDFATNSGSRNQIFEFSALGANGNEYDFAMAWTIEDQNRFLSDNVTPITISKNYYLTLDFTLYVHYKLMEGIDIEGGMFAYDGRLHYGSISFANANISQSSVIQGYALDSSHFDTSTNIYNDITSPYISFTNPGTYPVYYRLTAPEYEPLVGYFTIEIEKVERQNFEITSSNQKIYDTDAMFSKWLAGNNSYLPEFNYDLFALDGVTLSDNYDPAKIKIVYQLNGSSKIFNSTIGCVDAGNYLYTLTIPESDNYLETVYEGSFRIAKRQIIVSDTATKNEITYTGNTISYNNFGATSAYDLFYVDDLGNKNPLPSNYSLTGIIYTSSPNAGLYTGIDNTLSWFNGATITVDGVNQTINHTVSLEEATLTVAKARITYSDLTTKVAYDGNYHTVNIQMIMPLAYDSILYFDETTQTFTTDPTNFKFRDVGTYPVTVMVKVKNYEDEIIETEVIIERSESEVRIEVDLNKTYDGKEVVIPENIYTSNTEAQDITMYTFIYHEWILNTNTNEYEWALMSEIKWNKDINGWEVNAGATISRPVNVGKYFVEVIVPETTNYKAGSASQEFEIKALNVDVSWENLEFVYDGSPKKPSAYLPLCGDDVVPLIITVTPQTATANAEHKSVGGYLATAEIDTDKYKTGNYIINAMSSQTLFNISKRTVTISLNVFTPFVSEGSYYYELKTPTNPSGFTVAGLVNTPPYIHDVEGKLAVNNAKVGTYTMMDEENGFVWLNRNGETTKCLIVDEYNVDVTDNYNIKYNLNAVISYSNIDATVTEYIGTYDGLPHSIDVEINNVNASDYEVTYSVDNVTYSTNNPEFIDVVPNNGFYTVYYKITRKTDPTDTVSGTSRVVINPKDAQLSFVNPYINLGKIYDGIAIKNPEVVCNDPNANVVYKYYKNSVSDANLTVNSIVDVGTYVLVVDIENASNNYTYLPLERTFEITKRIVTINVPRSSKIYDTESWSKQITSADVYNIVGTHTFTGILQTKTVDVGTYENDEDFDWYNGYSIKDASNIDVTKNYEIQYDLSVEITNAPIQVVITPTITTYDGAQHTLTEIKLVDAVVGGVTYPAPIDYKIYYSENPNDGYTEDPIYKSMVGKWIVYLKIEADNYETLIIKNGEEADSYILINGLPFPGPDNPDDPFDPDDPEPGPSVNDPNLYYEKNYQYTGENYPTPEYLNSPSSGEQVVVYYELQDYLDNVDNLSNATPFTNVKNAGSYVFVLTIKTDGVYEETSLAQSFVIKPREVTLTWEELKVEYTGSELSPKAYYTQVMPDGGNKVYLSISNVPQIAAGKYQVTASGTDTNYTFANPIKEFEITQKVVEQPAFDILETTYGDELIIKDNSGNIYQIDEDGKVIAVVDENGDPIPNFTLPLPYIFILGDENADKDGSNHVLKIHFSDKDNNNGKSNYIWSVNKNSDDLEIPYIINPITFPDNEKYELIIVYDDVHTYTGEEIKPELELTVIYSKDNSTYAILELDKDYTVKYSNNIAVSTNDKKALIELTGINNYSFQIEKKFTIIAKEPDLLTIKEDDNVKIQFITAVYDRVNTPSNGVTIVEDDLVPERTAENIATESFYLSHIYQNTTVEVLLKMFMNDSKKMKVFSNKQNYLDGVAIDKEAYSSTFVGTGYVIALYEDEACTKLSDTIECIVFGDLNGDGNISLADINVIARILSNKVFVQTTENENNEAVEKIDDLYYFAGITKRGTSSVGLANLNDIARSLNSSVLDNDFNINYKFDPNQFVVPTPEEKLEDTNTEGN